MDFIIYEQGNFSFVFQIGFLWLSSKYWMTPVRVTRENFIRNGAIDIHIQIKKGDLPIK